MADDRPVTGLRALLREDLLGEKPYGAPQLSVRAALNTNENSYAVPPGVVAEMQRELASTLPDLNRYPDREFTALREKGAQHPIEKTGRELRKLMAWVKDSDADYTEGSAAR